MREQIQKTIRELEQEKGIRVLYACESGSRAWGFESPDSDYDIRFIYAQPLKWYLSICDKKDTIDQMLPDDLDLCGWELRKTLKLFSKCNVALYEWLLSPEIYCADENFHQRMKDLIPQFFNTNKAGWHYLSMAKRIKEKHLNGINVNIKKLFYILRPLFACEWIIAFETMPPTEFDKIFNAITLPQWLRDTVNELLTEKTSAHEHDTTIISEQLRDWIKAQIEAMPQRIEQCDVNVNHDLKALDQVLIETLTQAKTL